jgi:hypothetical protein
MQTRLESFVETTINVAIGFAISYSVGPLYFAYLGIDHDPVQNLVITTGFTVLSVARGYIIRRWFNARLKRLSHRIAEKLHD